MAEEVTKEHAKLDQIIERLDLLLTRVTEIGLDQQHMKHQMDVTAEMINQHTSDQQFMVKQLEETGRAVARLTLNQMRYEESQSSDSELIGEPIPQTQHPPPWHRGGFQRPKAQEVNQFQQPIPKQHTPQVFCPNMFAEMPSQATDYQVFDRTLTTPFGSSMKQVVATSADLRRTCSNLGKEEIIEVNTFKQSTVWDEDKQSNKDLHCDLLKLHTFEELTQEHADQKKVSLQASMLWDGMPASNDLHDDLLLQLACDGEYSDENTKLATNEKLTGEKSKCSLTLYNSSTWPSDQCSEYWGGEDRKPFDDEPTCCNMGTQIRLLEQLAEGGQFMGSEEIMMEVSLSPSELIPRDGSVALFSPEAAMYGAHLVLDEMPSANVVWEDVMTGDCGPWHGLLEELEQCDHYSVDEKTKPVVKLDVDVKPPHVASDEISRKVQWDDEQLPDQVADTSLLQQIAMGQGYPEGIIFSHADGHDADQMLDKASKHGMIELTHFSAVQLELVNDSVHENATAFAKTQAVSVSEQQSIFMVPLVFESATNMVFNKLPSMILVWYEEVMPDRLRRMQWDPGIITATAWGQAVFRGGGNVMTQRWPRRSPVYQPSSKPKRESVLYKRETSEGKDIEQKSENRIAEVKEASSSSSIQRSL